MFRIRQLDRGQVTHHRPAAAQESTTNQDEIKVTFKDGTSEIYLKSELSQLPIFKSLLELDKLSGDVTVESKESQQSEIAFTLVDRVTFDFVLDMVLEDKQFLEIASDEFFTNPFIIEDVRTALEFFVDPKISQSLIENILKREMPFMTRRQAVALVEHFEKAVTADNPRTKSASGEVLIPEAVKFAKTISMQALFFKSDAEADQHFENLQEYALERNRIKKKIEQLITSLVGRSEMETAMINAQITIFTKTLTKLEEEIASLVKRAAVDLKNLTTEQKMGIRRHQNHPDPTIRQLASQFNEPLEKRKLDIINALQKSGADMTRTALIEWLVGPKGMLLDYYGLIRFTDPNGRMGSCYPQYPFQNFETGCFKLSLNNATPFELEEEIRDHAYRMDVTKALPPPLMPEVAILRMLMDNEKQYILTKLQLWSDEQRCTDLDVREVKQLIIRRNGWNSFGITPNDIGFTAGQPSLNEDSKIVGKLNGTIEFWFYPKNQLIYINGKNLAETQQFLLQRQGTYRGS